MKLDSLKKINDAVQSLKDTGTKATQKRVADVSRLSLRTVKQYWKLREANPIDPWYAEFMKKVKAYKIKKSKTASFIKMLIEENNKLKEEIKILKSKSNGSSVDVYFNQLLKTI